MIVNYVIIGSNQPSNLPSSSFILSESLQRIDSQEVEQYKNLVLSGRIYDYFEQALREELGITYPLQEGIKEGVFQSFVLK